MKEQTFVSERGRLIKIVVAEYISFRFPSEGDREFYWIENEDWANSNEYWSNHMMQKRWFTAKMIEFLDGATEQYRHIKA